MSSCKSNFVQLFRTFGLLSNILLYKYFKYNDKDIGIVIRKILCLILSNMVLKYNKLVVLIIFGKNTSYTTIQEISLM